MITNATIFAIQTYYDWSINDILLQLYHFLLQLGRDGQDGSQIIKVSSLHSWGMTFNPHLKKSKLNLLMHYRVTQQLTNMKLMNGVEKK